MRSRFRDVSDYQPPITIPMSKLHVDTSMFFRHKPSRVRTFIASLNVYPIIFKVDDGLELPDNHIRRPSLGTNNIMLTSLSQDQGTETRGLLSPAPLEPAEILDRRTISESSAQSGYIQLPVTRPRTRTTTTGTTSSGYTQISDLPE